VHSVSGVVYVLQTSCYRCLRFILFIKNFMISHGRWCINFRASTSSRLLLRDVLVSLTLLISLNISVHHELLCYWVEQPVRFSFFIIPNKHILLALMFKVGPLLSWNTDISNAPKHFKIRHI